MMSWYLEGEKSCFKDLQLKQLSSFWQILAVLVRGGFDESADEIILLI